MEGCFAAVSAKFAIVRVATVALLWSVFAGCMLVDPLDESNPPAAESTLDGSSDLDELEFVYLVEGAFEMGSPAQEEGREDNEGPQHEVWISRFMIGKYEVTNAQYALFLLSNPQVPHPEKWDYKLPKSDEEAMTWVDLPATGMTWEEATQFANWAGGRLPTEAEWEYAARGQSQEARYGELDAIAWFDGNSDGVKHAVGLKQPNAWGAHDMLGNVHEWCLDSYRQYDSELEWNPLGPPGGSSHILRGGSFADPADFARAAHRLVKLDHRSNDFGFRIARNWDETSELRGAQNLPRSATPMPGPRAAFDASTLGGVSSR